MRAIHKPRPNDRYSYGPHVPFGRVRPKLVMVSFIIMILSVISGFATYFVLLGVTPLAPNSVIVISVMVLNAVCVVAMLIVIGVNIVKLLLAKRRGQAGSQLHFRLVSLFSIIAAVPIFLMAIFASYSLNQGLETWFSDRTKEIVRNSLNVAIRYVTEHGQNLVHDTQQLGSGIDSAQKIVKENATEFGQLLSYLAPLHRIDQAYIMDGSGRILSKYEKGNKATFLAISPGKLSRSTRKMPVIILPAYAQHPKNTKKYKVLTSATHQDVIRAVVRLDSRQPFYLYTIHKLDEKVAVYLKETRSYVSNYNLLARKRVGFQTAFGLMYIVIALTLLLSAMWIGLWFADKLVTPIRRLMAAAQQVSNGNLSASVSINNDQGELAHLGEMFNQMTEELRNQRYELMDTNTLLDERRLFTETVLAGVSAGVIGCDERGVITIYNKSAQSLLPELEGDVLGKKLEKLLPQFAELQQSMERSKTSSLQAQMKHDCDEGTEKELAVQVIKEKSDSIQHGVVFTFDDITELVVAQRTSAWADIARRIAHEIKNPLTPIQLSAESLRRKYSKILPEDNQKALIKYTDTIIRHVGDIGQMVDEFSAFARMPEPVMETHDLREIVKEGLLMFQMAGTKIQFKTHLPDSPMEALCDRRLLTQSVTNLVKNATEAVEAYLDDLENSSEKEEGRVEVRLTGNETSCEIIVTDNGCGLPPDMKNRLFEPYVTTRQKGTGLGLAIVKKIIEQHKGTIRIRDIHECFAEEVRGTCVEIQLPVAKSIAEADSRQSHTIEENKIVALRQKAIG